MSQVHVILVQANEHQTHVHSVYRNLEDAKAVLYDSACGEPGTDEWSEYWGEGGSIHTCELN